jgi:acyl carrier protein
MDAFIRAFEEILDLPPGSVNAQTEFKEMAQWDSLAQLSVMTIIEDIYRKVVGPALLRNSRTIGDLIASIEAA